MNAECPQRLPITSMAAVPPAATPPAVAPAAVEAKSSAASSAPPQPSASVPKRIIVCCDGTWQDGIVSKRRWQYSNVLKISRTIQYEDKRHNPPIPQIVFYQAGVGSEKNIYAEYVEGATGASLAEKVQEAYAFIAHNYQNGDEIFLFGFSRGAYTARMVAAFVGEIGVLDRKDMDHFADIFIAYQKLGKTQDPKELEEVNKVLQPFNNPQAKGRLRADADRDTFTIKVVGVWDTVGSLGLPEELTFSKKLKQLFGFCDKLLGNHIQHAFHAMALHETRADFDVAKFEQTQAGRDKGQTLKQVWFAGSHSDIGGGWQTHDLSDISLMWMASNIQDMLAIDIDYLCGIPNPVAPWGTQVPHDPRTGIFTLSKSIHRTVPTTTDKITNETIHHSVTYQELQIPQVQESVKSNAALVGHLAELEERVKTEWPYVPGARVLKGKTAESEKESQDSERQTLLQMAKDKAERSEVMVDEGGKPRYTETWVGRIIHEILG